MCNISEVKEKIYMIVRNGDGDSFDDAYNIYKIIVENLEEFFEQVVAFQYACEIYGTLESDDTYILEKAPYKNEKSELENEFGEIVNTLLANYIKKNVPEENFYTSIWKIICDPLIFSTEKSKVFSLYYILIDARIPYFMLDYKNRYTVSNEKYKELRHKYTKEIQKMRFILKASYKQKTERASSLLAELGISVPTEEATLEQIETYEKKLMQMIEVLSDSHISPSLIRELMSGLEQ